MASSMIFLRPLPAPSRIFCRSFLRHFNASTRTCEQAQGLNIPTASSTIKASTENPLSQYSPPTTTGEAAELLATKSLPYHIHRSSKGDQLPIYHINKRNGFLKLTRLRRISGDIKALKTDLQQSLNLEDKHIKINHLTQQIIIKGWRKWDVAKFLRERAF